MNKKRNELMTVHGSTYLRSASLSVTLILGASMMGCIADDTDQNIDPGDDNAVVNDEGAEANLGDHPIDSNVADATSEAVGVLRFWYVNKPFHDDGCAVGSKGSTRPNSTYPWPDQALDVCPTRVWLYQYANYTGAKLCVSPHTASASLTRAWRSYSVSANHLPCPAIVAATGP
jgi:hypothetical protein